MDKSKISVILSEGWVGPRGAKDLRDDRGSAPGFVRRSFAPTPAPTLSLRLTVGWFGFSITSGGTRDPAINTGEFRTAQALHGPMSQVLSQVAGRHSSS